MQNNMNNSFRTGHCMIILTTPPAESVLPCPKHRNRLEFNNPAALYKEYRILSAQGP